MKNKYLFLGLAVGLCSAVFTTTSFPEADITNGIVKAKLYLPGVRNGYYRDPDLIGEVD